MNTVYILATKPYFDQDNATLDYMNCFFLIAICVLTSTYSAWNTNTYDRFLYGILFDVLVGLQFICNMVFVLGQVVSSLALKIKQMRFRTKRKHQLKSKKSLRVRQAAEHALKLASL
jgi:hypothetical protein